MARMEMKEAMTNLKTQWKVLDQLQGRLCSRRIPPSLDFLDSFPLTATEDVAAFLETHRRHILTLSKQLSYDIRKYANVLVSLDRHPLDDPKPTLLVFPNEVLMEIFSHIAKDGNHRLRPLLLVNRRIHLLVTSRPSLWTNFNISVDERFDVEKGLSPSWIKASLKRAKDLLLAVTIDCDALPSAIAYANSLVEEATASIPGINSIPNLDILVIELSDINYKHWDYYAEKLQRITDLIQTIVGQNGALMRRWKSAIIALPEDEQAPVENIIDLLVGGTPYLETIRVNSWDRYIFKNYPLGDNGVFPNLSGVQKLDIDAIFDLREVSINFTKVSSLGICLVDRSRNLDALTSCELLQELTIRCDARDSIGRYNLQFPSLKLLKLIDLVGCLNHVTFSTPASTRMELFYNMDQPLPTAQASTVLWSFLTPIEGDDYDCINASLLWIARKITGVKNLMLSTDYIRPENLVYVCDMLSGCFSQLPNLETTTLAVSDDFVETVYRATGR
ncbi:hypothetical protein FRC17_004349 [Serendipita sp. 399]|nr:hypothetical protein FRC17_004349 [Serendipita sp. 399]